MLLTKLLTSVQHCVTAVSLFFRSIKIMIISLSSHIMSILIFADNIY